MSRSESGAPTTAVLWSRNFTVYLTGQTISQVGNGIAALAIVLAVLALDGGAGALAAATTALYLPYLVLAAPAGTLADRVDRRRLMITADVARFAAGVAMVVAYTEGHLVSLVALAALQSSCGVFYEAARFAAVPHLVPREAWSRANSWVQSSFGVGAVVGPVIAGVGFARGHGAAVLLLDTASFAVAAVSLCLTSSSFGPDAAAPATRRPTAFAAWKSLLMVPLLRRSYWFTAGINLLSAGVATYLALFVGAKPGLEESDAGYLMTAAATGLLLTPPAMRLLARWGEETQAALGSVLRAAALGAALAVDSLALLCVLWALAGIGIGVVQTSIVTLRQAVVPREAYGQAGSLSRMISFSAVPVGAWLCAPLVAASGPGAPLAAYVAGAAVLTLAFAAPWRGRPAETSVIEAVTGAQRTSSST